MNNLNNIVKNYLSNQTNYAILITGEWGVGKTYFVQNELVRTVEKTETIEDASEFYKQINISLFGLKTIDDIQAQILINFYDFFGSDKLKIQKAVAKLFTKGLMRLQGLSPNDFFTDIKSEGKNLINLSQVFIVFDDLERRSRELSIEELLGFINTLVEQNSVKVLLIANEGEKEANVFKKYKEKVIGVQVEFIQNFDKTYDNLIKQRYSESKWFIKMLIERKSIFQSLHESKPLNLRSLIFALDNIKSTLSILKKDVLDLPEYNEHLIHNKLSNIIRYVVGISFEYKDGVISYSERQDLETLKLDRFLRFPPEDFTNNSDNTIIEEELATGSYADQFEKKYFEELNSAKHFDRLYDFITGGIPFNGSLFITEFEELFNIKKNELLPQYQVLLKLDFEYDLKLTDKEYRMLTNEMISFAKKGKYKINEYLTIFIMVVRYDNILKKNIEELVNKLEKGIKKIKVPFDIRYTLDMYLNIPRDQKYQNELKKIRATAIKHDELISKKIEEQKIRTFFQKLESVEELEKILFDQNSEWINKPVFCFVSPNKLISFMNKLNNENLLTMKNFLVRRFKKITPENNLTCELTFCSRLYEMISKPTKKRKQKTRRNFIFNSFQKDLEKILAQKPS